MLSNSPFRGRWLSRLNLYILRFWSDLDVKCCFFKPIHFWYCLCFGLISNWYISGTMAPIKMKNAQSIDIGVSALHSSSKSTPDRVDFGQQRRSWPDSSILHGGPVGPTGARCFWAASGLCALYIRRIHRSAPRLIYFDVRFRLRSPQAQLKLAHYVQRFHTKNQYGISYGPFGLVSLSGFVTVCDSLALSLTLQTDHFLVLLF